MRWKRMTDAEMKDGTAGKTPATHVHTHTHKQTRVLSSGVYILTLRYVIQNKSMM